MDRQNRNLHNGISAGWRKRGSAAAILSLLLITSAMMLQAAVLPLEFSPKRARVGDPITLTLTVPNADPGDIQWPSTAEKIGDFRVLHADTLKGKEAKAYPGPTLLLTVAAYDTGAHSTDTLEVWVNKQIHRFEPANVYIYSVLDSIPQDTTGPSFRPLKAQVPLKMTLADWARLLWPYLLGVAVLAGIFFFIRWWQKRKLGVDGEGGIYVKPPPPPYDEAVAALRDLQRDKPHERGEYKLFVSRLTEILKRLLERVHSDPVMDMTTYEVKRWLIHATIFGSKEDLLSILNDADMIKFAKGSIDSAKADSMLRTADSFVLTYKPRPVETLNGNGQTEDSAEPSAQTGEAALPEVKTSEKGEEADAPVMKKAEPVDRDDLSRFQPKGEDKA